MTKKKYSINTLLSGLFVATLVFFMLGYIYTYTTYKVQQQRDNALIAQIVDEGYLYDKENINIDYAKIYPFAHNVAKENNAGSQNGVINQFLVKVNALIDKINKFSDEYVIGRASFIKGYGYINDFLNMHLVNQEALVYKMPNGYLTYLNSYLDVSNNIENLSAFNDYVSANNQSLLYVQAPYKISKYDSELQSGIDYSNDNADRLIAGLNDLDVLDLRDSFYADGYKNPDLYFKSDHHWKPEAGLLATQYLVDYLKDQAALDIDTSIIDHNNFNYQIYNDYFLGSLGKKTGLGLIDSEDITIITPSFDTSFTYVNATKGLNVAGSFEQVMFNYAQLYKKDYYNLSPYEAYAHSNSALSTIVNHNSANDTKLLLIRDSYSSVVAPFLALSVKQLDIIDLRFFNGSLENYIANNVYDKVIVLYNPSAIVSVEGDDLDNFFYFK